MRFLTVLLVFWGLAAQAQVPVSLSQGTNIAAAVSPDGKQIAFDLQGALWAMPSAGGPAKVLTDPALTARAPAWSADNRTIVFQGSRDGRWHLWSVRLDGGGLSQLTTGPQDDREPYVSPDGRMIAFASDRRGNDDIYVMPLTGGEARAITTSPANDMTPAWSPDGRQIGFVSDRGKGAGLYVIDANGGPEKLIVTDPGLTAPMWRPDGQAFVYVAQNGDTSRLRTVGALGGAPLDVSAPVEDVFPFRVSWLSPGAYAYTADGSIKRRDVAGGEAKVIPFTATMTAARGGTVRRTAAIADAGPHPAQGLHAPQISPDGQQIAFGAFGDIFLWDVDPQHMRDGKPPKVRRLERDEAMDSDPIWAPDGSQLAFVSERSGTAEIWLRDLKTNKERQLTHGAGRVALPSWSPDSKRIALYILGGADAPTRARLGIANVFTGDIQDVHTPLESPGRAAWSPDGKTLAVSAAARASSRSADAINAILLISLAGGPDRMVSPTPGRSLARRGVDGPAWSPDGSKMAYIQDGLLWVVPVNGKGPHAGEMAGTPRALTTELAAAPSWSGDSKSLLYLATDRLKRIDLDGPVTDFQPNVVWSRNVPPGRTVVWAGRLWDGVGQTYRSNVDVVMEGNLIAAIEPHRDRPGAVMINASSQTVIPGLIDSDAQVAVAPGSQVGRLLLSYGITAIGEPGADPYQAIERRESWASGIRLGPRDLIAGGVYGGARLDEGEDESIATPAQLDLDLGRAHALGYDFIAAGGTLSSDLLKTAIEKAHSLGLPVQAREVTPAATFGADSAVLLSISRDRSALGFSYGDVAGLAAKSGMAVIPKLAAQGGFLLAALRDRDLLNLPQVVKPLRDEDRAALAASVIRVGPLAAVLQRRVGAMQQSLRQIVAGGGRVLATSGAPNVPPGLSFLTELRLYQDAGVPPLQVLQSATVWPAEALGLGDRLGTIEPGKLADFVILAGDPLNRVADVANVRGVVADGHYYLIDELLRGQ